MNIGKFQAVASGGSFGRLLRVLPWIAATCILFAQADRGRIESGWRADLIVLDRELNLKAVFVGGRELD